MPPSISVVIADDLTGACEAAGLLHRLGRSTRISLDPQPAATDGTVLVLDTETRLTPAAEAGATIRRIVAGLSPTTGVFKKTDSVLRGPVAAELEALAGHLQRPRILLAPANPDLGRRLVAGRYAIHGTPLHHTAFAHDPHHPATTDDVLHLLGDASRIPRFALDSDQPAPERGLILANTSDSNDLLAWARRVDDHTVPAGSVAFLAAILHGANVTAAPGPITPTAIDALPVLLLTGTTAPNQRVLAATATPETVPVAANDPDEASTWAARIRRQLQGSGRCVAFIEGPVTSDPAVAAHLPHRIGALAQALFAGPNDPPLHLVVEGGATAAAVASALGWRNFTVRHEWSPGVVSLIPAPAPNLLLTLKPGSYPWAPALAARLGLPASSAKLTRP